LSGEGETHPPTCFISIFYSVVNEIRENDAVYIRHALLPSSVMIPLGASRPPPHRPTPCMSVWDGV